MALVWNVMYSRFSMPSKFQTQRLQKSTNTHTLWTSPIEMLFHSNSHLTIHVLIFAQFRVHFTVHGCMMLVHQMQKPFTFFSNQRKKNKNCGHRARARPKRPQTTFAGNSIRINHLLNVQTANRLAAESNLICLHNFLSWITYKRGVRSIRNSIGNCCCCFFFALVE